MIHFTRLPRCVTALALVALVALPLTASAQGGAGLSDASNLGVAARYWLVVGKDSTAFQKVEVTWTSPASRMVAPRQPASARSTDADRTGAASIKFIRAAGQDSRKVQAWLQRGNTLEPVHVAQVDDKGRIVSTMTAPSFKAEKWSINAMDAGASQVAIETLVVSTPELRVQGPGFGD